MLEIKDMNRDEEQLNGPTGKINIAEGKKNQ